MRTNRNTLKTAWPIWLVILGALIAVVLSCPATASRGTISTYYHQSIAPLSLGYDGEGKANVAYDGSQKPFFDYDKIVVLFARQKESRSESVASPFGHFSKFLAAEGGAGEQLQLIKQDSLGRWWGVRGDSGQMRPIGRLETGPTSIHGNSENSVLVSTRRRKYWYSLEVGNYR
jgi:hypothetical protein